MCSATTEQRESERQQPNAAEGFIFPRRRAVELVSGNGNISHINFLLAQFTSLYKIISSSMQVKETPGAEKAAWAGNVLPASLPA